MKKILEFLQEPTGEMSSRRLIMIVGSLLTIPVALVFGWFHPLQFIQILDALLIYLGTMGGLTLASKFAKNQNEEKKIMTIEAVIDTIKYLWIPFLGFAYKNYLQSQEKQDAEISKLKEKISQQMTKQDVVEVVDNAVEKLTLKIEKDLLKIDNGVHQIKNQFSGKDGTSLQVIEILERINKILDEKK